MKYFGPARFKKEYEEQVPTPVGMPCQHCREPIVEGDLGTFRGPDDAIHYECALRGAVGSVGHQMGKCSCYGGNEDDPPNTTRRQAAIAAARLWDEKHSH